MTNEELHKLWIDRGQGMKALKSVYQQGRADAIEELLNIKNPCDDCYMELCESCKHNGEYAFNIQNKLEQLKEQEHDVL